MAKRSKKITICENLPHKSFLLTDPYVECTWNVMHILKNSSSCFNIKDTKQRYNCLVNFKYEEINCGDFSDQLIKEDCIMKELAENKRYDGCKELKIRDHCFLYFAFKFFDAEYCNFIYDYTERIKCFRDSLSFAKYVKIEMCETIEDLDYKNSCYAITEQDMAFCNKISSPEIKEFCKNTLIFIKNNYFKAIKNEN